VLVRNLMEKGGPGKLRSHWEDKVYVVSRRMASDSPVYEVKAEDDPRRTRVLHRNLLFQCDFLPFDSQPISPTKHVLTRRGRNERDQGRRCDQLLRVVETSSSESHDLRSRGSEDLPEVSQTSENSWVDAEPFVPGRTSHKRANGPREVSSVPEEASLAQDQGRSDADPSQTAYNLGGSSERVTSGSDVSSPETEVPRRAQRMRRPARTLTYDHFGRPSYQPLVRQLAHTMENPSWSC
jgi:hypothetical protein